VPNIKKRYEWSRNRWWDQAAEKNAEIWAGVGFRFDQYTGRLFRQLG
jgi:hypothetical protein